jgi:hypothetical protein
MIGKRFAILGTLALFGSLLVGARANADYTYTTSITINSVSGGGSATPPKAGGVSTATSANLTTLQLQDIASPGTFIPAVPLTANIGNVSIVPTGATPDTFTVGYTDVITITNPAPGGATGTFTITGTLTATGVFKSSSGAFAGTITNVYNPPLNQGPITLTGLPFTVNFGTGQVNDLFGTPTIGSPLGTQGTGNLGSTINSIPEPSSVVMLGLGLVGVAGIGLRRRA